MSRLKLAPDPEKSDDLYAAILAAHEGLDEKATHEFNARLILILANHLGDLGLLKEALAAATIEQQKTQRQS